MEDDWPDLKEAKNEEINGSYCIIILKPPLPLQSVAVSGMFVAGVVIFVGFSIIIRMKIII